MSYDKAVRPQAGGDCAPYERARGGRVGVVLLAMVILLSAPVSAQQTQQMPPFGIAVQKLLELAAEPTETRARAFADAHLTEQFRESRPISALLEQARELGAVLGRGEILQLIAESPGERLAVIRSSLDGERYTLRFGVDGGTPPKIAAIALAQPASLVSVPAEELAQRLRAEVAAEVAEMGFSGVVLVTRGEETILEAAYGLANRDTRVPNALDMRYNLGSGDKLFTKIGIGQLVSAGRISLADTVGRFLPDYPNETVRRKVTIEHLLRHRSGLGSHLDAAVQVRDRRIRSLQDLLALVAQQGPAFEPGTRERYSNTGYLLLGRILEVVTGESYFDYVQKTIFDAVGMTRTAYLTLDEWPADRAMGYTAASEGRGPDFENPARQILFRPHTDQLPHIGSSAGGGYSTARDIARLDRALREGRLLASELEPIMFLRSPDGRRTLVANGGAPGVQFDYRRIGDYTVIVFANMDPPAAPRLTARLLGVLANVQ